MTKTSAIVAIAAVAGLTAAANAQFTLNAGDIKYRVIADNTTIDINDAGDRTINMILQVRYDGGQVNASSVGGFEGRIASNELLASGTLDRTLLASPFQGAGAGGPTRRGMADPHRDLFNGGIDNNNALANGGAPDGMGEFVGLPGFAGFGNIIGSDLTFGAVGRAQGTQVNDNISVGLHDTVLEGDPAADFARWDSIYFFTYVVTDLTPRTITFNYQPKGSLAYPGTAADKMIWRNGAAWVTSGAALGTAIEGASIQVVPTPGSAALLGLGGVLAARRRRNG